MKKIQNACAKACAIANLAPPKRLRKGEELWRHAISTGAGFKVQIAIGIKEFKPVADQPWLIATV